MKDLRIVIVSWNVEELLDRCLKSLHTACEGLDWDVVVIDNASHDGSVDVAKANGARLITNQDNRGFARACNQGLADNNARYVLLLNPDTECLPGSLTELVRAADGNPKAGVLGPQLNYPDRTYQQSVRRFPTVWNQAAILLKLHHVFPWFFRRYFASDINAKKEQTVDQVMGACFLIRREVIEQVGGLDERYFIWFEEVDYCRMVKEKGWYVMYVPSSTVIHHGGQSFVQVFSPTKQRYFDVSLIKYFAKWQPGWRVSVLKLVDPVARGIAWFVNIRNKPDMQWIFWICGIIIFELASVATVFHPLARGIVTIILGIAMFFLAKRRPDLGLAVMLVELMLGSKGALTKIPHGTDVDGGISLRIIWTSTFLLGWAWNAFVYWRGKSTELRLSIREAIKGRGAWIALALLVIWGVVRGAWVKNPMLMNDANAWAFIVMLIPVLDIASRDGKRLIHNATQAAIAALLWLPIETLLLLYVFSHGIKSLSQPLYLWVRRTGVGEVTLVTGNLFRIFIQSQIYAIGGFFLAVAGVVAGSPRPSDRSIAQGGMTPPLRFAVLIGCIVLLSVGLSRSFWIGLACGALCLAVLTLRGGRAQGIAPTRIIGRIFGAGLIALLLLVATVAFPYPHVDVGSLATLFGSRAATTDAAAESRWNLLPVLIAKIKQAPILGSGFGATVTYHSKDPRILAQNPDGLYTTYAFEWGWIEHWIKFGILGIPVMLWLVLSLIQRTWRAEGEWWIRVGLISTLVALASLHVFTPYLNHPLGFGILFIVEGWIAATSVRARTLHRS